MEFHTYEPAFVASVRGGGPDANGQVAEHAVSEGVGTPCRCCLENTPKGAGMLILAARPFPKLQPYAETGPIFLCAENCEPWQGEGMPPILKTSPDYLLKAYRADNRIYYGTGKIVTAAELVDYAADLLGDDAVAYVDVRSARNNCFLTRITR
ncbi:MAG: DUF1203 domain-containing protein [Paracoccaceae bacterium]